MPIKSTLFASLLAASAGIIMASPIIAGLSPREANNPLLLSVLFGNKLDGSEVSSDRDFGDGDPITLLADASCGRISITQIDRGNVFAQFTFPDTLPVGSNLFVDNDQTFDVVIQNTCAGATVVIATNCGECADRGEVFNKKTIIANVCVQPDQSLVQC